MMSFGTHATVVRPQVLRERLRKTALEVGERHAKERELFAIGQPEAIAPNSSAGLLK